MHKMLTHDNEERLMMERYNQIIFALFLSFFAAFIKNKLESKNKCLIITAQVEFFKDNLVILLFKNRFAILFKFYLKFFLNQRFI